MDKKYSVGDKVVTADNWNNGMGRIIPKGSVVEIIRAFELFGDNMYECEYNGDRPIYEESWLGEKYVQLKIGGWIPCSERLPEEGQQVLATHQGGVNPERQVILHTFKDGQFIFNWDMDTKFGSPTFGQHYMGDVIAWQPLPDPYRE